MSDKYEVALSLVMELSSDEKEQLLAQVSAALKKNQAVQQKPQRSSWAGICADLGPAPSAEEIDEVRREMWKNFPREDI